MTKSTSKLFQSEKPEKKKEDAKNLPEEVKALEPIKDALEAEVMQEVPAEPKEEVVEESTAVVEEAKTDVQDDIQDINLSVIKKKKFRINGEADKVIELNTSDLNILSRLTVAYDRLTNYMDKVGTILSKMSEDADSNEVMNQLKAIDAEMRKEIDYIFDSPISDKCADGGSMYDPFEGQFRFEHIIEAVLKLYERNLDSEFNKMKKKVATRTSKYTKKYHN